MKRCKRCKASKPDSVFDAPVYRGYQKGGYSLLTDPDLCLHCRSIRLEMGFKTSPPKRPPTSPKPSEEALEASRIFAEELEKWKARGEPEVKRTYVYHLRTRDGVLAGTRG